jgi:hypothetical protein
MRRACLLAIALNAIVLRGAPVVVDSGDVKRNALLHHDVLKDLHQSKQGTAEMVRPLAAC